MQPNSANPSDFEVLTAIKNAINVKGKKRPGVSRGQLGRGVLGRSASGVAHRSFLTRLLLVAAIPLALMGGAPAQVVGAGTPPGAHTRVIEIGTAVVENEKIQTTATGSVQVLLIDKTTLNVGPNSTLVIDRFVYDPATTKGELTLSLSQGVMRIVGGAATHSKEATIRTPVAAIGLRDGIAIISHSGANGTHAILSFGRMSVTSLCGAANCTPTTVDVSRPGYSVTVAEFNQPPSAPGRASTQELAALREALARSHVASAPHGK